MSTSIYVLRLTDAEASRLEKAFGAPVLPRTEDELSDLADGWQRREYWSSVRAMAEDLMNQLKAEDYNPAEDEDAAREWLGERLWESVDGSEWVIYTHRAMDCLRWSENDGYTLEEWGEDGIATEGVLNWSRLAFGALYADVSELLWDSFDEWTEQEGE